MCPKYLCQSQGRKLTEEGKEVRVGRNCLSYGISYTILNCAYEESEAGRREELAQGLGPTLLVGLFPTNPGLRRKEKAKCKEAQLYQTSTSDHFSHKSQEEGLFPWGDQGIPSELGSYAEHSLRPSHVAGES